MPVMLMYFTIGKTIGVGPLSKPPPTSTPTWRASAPSTCPGGQNHLAPCGVRAGDFIGLSRDDGKLRRMDARLTLVHLLCATAAFALTAWLVRAAARRVPQPGWPVTPSPSPNSTRQAGPAGFTLRWPWAASGRRPGPLVVLVPSVATCIWRAALTPRTARWLPARLTLRRA